MIQKKIVEIFTLIFYWFIITPFVFGVCHHYKWVTWDENDKMESIRVICGLILALAAGYMVVYLIVVLVYLQIKSCTMVAWKNYEERTVEMLQVERGYYEDNDPRLQQNSEGESDGNETEEDEVDGRRAARRAPKPPAERVHRPKRKARKAIRHPAPPPPYEEVNNTTV